MPSPNAYRNNEELPPARPRPAGRRKSRRPAARSFDWFWPIVVVGMTAGGSVSFLIVVNMETVFTVFTIDVMTALRFMTAGGSISLAVYFFSLNKQEKVHPRTALIKGVTGMVFGWIGGHAGAGAGLNEHLQTVSAGISGAKGQDILNKVTDKFMDKL